MLDACSGVESIAEFKKNVTNMFMNEVIERNMLQFDNYITSGITECNSF